MKTVNGFIIKELKNVTPSISPVSNDESLYVFKIIAIKLGMLRVGLLKLKLIFFTKKKNNDAKAPDENKKKIRNCKII